MSTNQVLDQRNWHQLVLPFAKPSLRKSTWQMIDTLVPYFALWLAMLWSLKVSYWLTLALAIPATGLRSRR